MVRRKEGKRSRGYWVHLSTRDTSCCGKSIIVLCKNIVSLYVEIICHWTNNYECTRRCIIYVPSHAMIYTLSPSFLRYVPSPSFDLGFSPPMGMLGLFYMFTVRYGEIECFEGTWCVLRLTVRRSKRRTCHWNVIHDEQLQDSDNWADYRLYQGAANEILDSRANRLFVGLRSIDDGRRRLLSQPVVIINSMLENAT